MTVHEIDRLCYRVSHDHSFLARLLADPSGVLATLPLSQEERRDLLAGDVLALYRRGAHPVLLVRLATHRVFGLTPQLYGHRISAPHPAGGNP